MADNKIQKYTSKKTSINKSKPPRVYSEVLKRDVWKFNSTNLDIGGGAFDSLSHALSKHEVLNLIYDPYNRSKEHNEAVLRVAVDVDSVTISNVLNVIKEKDVRLSVLSMAKNRLKSDGKLYITVYEGDKSGNGKQTGLDQWQNNMKTIQYLDEVKQVFPFVEKRGYLIIATKV